MDINNSAMYNIYIDFDKMNSNKFPNIVFSESDIKTSKIKVVILKHGEIIDLSEVGVDIKIINSKYLQYKKEITDIDKVEGSWEYVFEKDSLIEGIGYFQFIISFSNNKSKATPKIRYKVTK